MSSIKISQWNKCITSGTGTILDRALRQGVPYPHQCRSGECGRCKSRLINGKVEHLPHLDIALNDQERAGNLILACRCLPVTDIEVAWLDVEPLPRGEASLYSVEVVARKTRGRVTLLTVKQMTDDLPLHYIAGQYVYFHVPGCPARPYSMASVSGQDTLEFHIEHHADGWVSEVVATQLSIGDRFAITGPEGDACLQTNESGPLLAIGSGTGMAPMLAIVKSSLATNPQRPVALIYTEREYSHQYLHAELLGLSSKYKQLLVHQIVAQNQGENHECLGDQLTSCLLQLPFSISTSSVYVAGSSKKVQWVANTVKLLGAHPELIRADAFTTTVAKPQAESLAMRFGKLLFARRRSEV